MMHTAKSCKPSLFCSFFPCDHWKAILHRKIYKSHYFEVILIWSFLKTTTKFSESDLQKYPYKDSWMSEK